MGQTSISIPVELVLVTATSSPCSGPFFSFGATSCCSSGFVGSDPGPLTGELGPAEAAEVGDAGDAGEAGEAGENGDGGDVGEVGDGGERGGEG